VTVRRAPGGAVLVALAVALSLGLTPVSSGAEPATPSAAGPDPAAAGPGAPAAAPSPAAAPAPKPHAATLTRQTPWAPPDGDVHLGLAFTGEIPDGWVPVATRLAQQKKARAKERAKLRRELAKQKAAAAKAA